jgi:predicted lipoprotein
VKRRYASIAGVLGPAAEGHRHSSRLLRVVAASAVVVVLVVLWFAGLIATVKPIEKARSVAAIAQGGTAFDKVKYVDSIWQSRVLPAVETTSTSIDKLIPALEKDPESAVKEFGNNVGGAYNFLIYFTGTVSSVDTSSMTGTVTVNADYENGHLPVKVQIGPIILGTALRDALKFISFEQFLNQIQYGGVSDELNSRVEKDVVSKLDLKTLKGKTVSVKGAFTYDGANARDILVTPVLVTVG